MPSLLRGNNKPQTYFTTPCQRFLFWKRMLATDWAGLYCSEQMMIAVVKLCQNLFPIESPSHGARPYLLAMGVTLIRHIKFLSVCRL